MSKVAPSVRSLVKRVVFDRVPGLLRRGSATAPRVALTFDDGPDEMTPQYLDLLERLGVPATFFVIGDRAEANPTAIRDYVRRGHQVAGHGYDHASFPKLARSALRDQCSKTERALGQVSGRPWVRPPHGALDAASLFTLVTSGYTVALWSLDSCDYTDRDPASLADRCRAATAGEVLLFHEGQQWTLEAIPQIVASLRASGLECVTMQDLYVS